MRHVTLTPPSADLYAAVQVETLDGVVIGAAPAFTVQDGQMTPAPRVGVDLKPTDASTLRAGWLHENSALGVDWQTLQPDRNGNLAPARG